MALPFNITPSAILANTILGLNLITGTLRADVVAILDQETFRQVFAEARPVDAGIRESKKIMEHPVEKGTSVADHQVIDPRQIELLLVIASQDFSGAFQQIHRAWESGQLLIVQTKAATYRNMVIQNIPRKETVDRFDVTLVALQLKEILFELPSNVTAPATVTYYSPADPRNQSQVLRGLQNSVINPAAALLSLINAYSVWGE